MTVDKAPLTITTGSASKTYDGKALTNPDAKITGLVGGETAAVEATGSQTEAGSSPNIYAIEWDTAKEENYAVTEELGTLTVAPAGKCTVTFKDWDDTVLQSVEVAKGETPEFTGATPTRPPDGKYTYEFAGWEPEVAKVTGDATYRAKFAATLIPPPPEPAYRATSGGGSAYVEGTGVPLAFTFERTVDPEAAFAHFAGIEVDGRAVPEKSAAGSTNYTAVPGSVVVKLQPSYLETLSPGAHTITALFDDGDCLGNLMSARLDKLMLLSKAVDLLVGSCQFPLWSLEVLAGMSSQFGFPRKPCCHLVLYPGSFEVRDIFPSPCH
ncbi:MAG: hypothetical protein IJI68_00495 [Eggerthellaceae bacterium]|nr:hypothetical protein [Eggerthellaceae bacterium]